MLIAQLSDSHLKRPGEVAYGGHVGHGLVSAQSDIRTSMP